MLSIFRRVAVAALAIAMGGVGFAQDRGREWVQLIDGSRPGEQPRVTVVDQVVDGQSSLLVEIPGFWIVTPEKVSDPAERRIEVPGLGGRFGAVGGPGVPTIPLTLFVGSPEDGGGVDVGGFEPLEDPRFFQLLLQAEQPDVLELERGEQEEPDYAFDRELYETGEELVKTPVEALRRPMELGGEFAFDTVEVRPFQYVPGERLLSVTPRFIASVRWPYRADGREVKLSRRRFAEITALADNLTVGLYPREWFVEFLDFDSRILIVTREKNVDELGDFAAFKRSQGYGVSIRTTDGLSNPNDPAQVKQVVRDWYNAFRERSDDFYLILIGDTAEMPLHQDPENGNDSDRWYGCMTGGATDIYPEIGVGRFPSDSEADLKEMLANSIRYQKFGPSFADRYYREPLLVGHNSDAGEGYIDVCEDIADASYLTGLSWVEVYGDRAGGTNANLVSTMSEGHNITLYRGHGDTSIWWQWDLGDNNWDVGEIQQLTNDGSEGIVLSIACTTSDLAGGESLAESFLEGNSFMGGAVAHYGGTVVTYRSDNNNFSKKFFKYVYGQTFWDLVTLVFNPNPILIDTLDRTMARVLSDSGNSGYARWNAWCYMLCGDPTMKIWRTNPRIVYITEIIDFDRISGLLTVRFAGQDGGVIANTIVSASTDDRTVDAVYTDANGIARLRLDADADGVVTIAGSSETEDVLPAAFEFRVPDRCRADLNGDGAADIFDILLFFELFGGGDDRADFEPDGRFDIFDILRYFEAFADCG